MKPYRAREERSNVVGWMDDDDDFICFRDFSSTVMTTQAKRWIMYIVKKGMQIHPERNADHQ